MNMRRTLVAVLVLGALALPMTAAGAAAGNVSGTLTGPGGFRPEGCGIISEIGHGTYRASGLGEGTYVFDVCITSTSPITFAGTVTFTRRGGATLTGTIGGTFTGGSGPTFLVTVTGGTRHYRGATGSLGIGPLVESDPHNCDPRIGICLDWTDTGPLTGTLDRVRVHG
jgi:hypothetical protein